MQNISAGVGRNGRRWFLFLPLLLFFSLPPHGFRPAPDDYEKNNALIHLERRISGPTADYRDLSPAWQAAYRFLAARSPYLRRHEERLRCLAAVWAASSIIIQDPAAADLFAGREEVFLLLVAQGMAESNGNPKAISPQGDLGWAQINRSMLRVLAVEDPFDVAENAAGQARHLRALLGNLGRRWKKEKSPAEIVRLALAAYNASSRAVQDGRVPAEGPVAAYVNRVMENYTFLKKESEVITAWLPRWKPPDA
ncbi:MAG: lytic transglycosylase domain-containing protein [Bacillota bacterium]